MKKLTLSLAAAVAFLTVSDSAEAGTLSNTQLQQIVSAENDATTLLQDILGQVKAAGRLGSAENANLTKLVNWQSSIFGFLRADGLPNTVLNAQLAVWNDYTFVQALVVANEAPLQVKKELSTLVSASVQLEQIAESHNLPIDASLNEQIQLLNEIEAIE